MLARQHARPAAAATRAGAPPPTLAAANHCRNRNRRRRRAVDVAAASSASPSVIATDASARVVGTPASVASFISRVDETWPAWYPRLASATRVGDSNTFDVVVRAAGGGQGGFGGLLASFLPTVELPVRVELLERSPKSVAFRATSSLHAAQEQYVLMPCPSDPRGHTTVRHVSEVRLRGAWANGLAAPVVGGLMAGVPREALERLAAALRSEQQQERQQQQERRQQAGRRRSAGGKEVPSPESWGGAGLFGGAAAPAPGAGLGARDGDPHGLYAALALDPRDRPAAEAVRAAYRRRAALLHPDANLGAAAADAGRARAEFGRVARAYAVLFDDAARRAYDRGEWRPAEGEEDL